MFNIIQKFKKPYLKSIGTELFSLNRLKHHFQFGKYGIGTKIKPQTNVYSEKVIEKIEKNKNRNELVRSYNKNIQILFTKRKKIHQLLTVSNMH